MIHIMSSTGTPRLVVMTGMYKAMEDCVGLGVDEIMDVEQVIILYKRWTIFLAYHFQI